MKLMKLFSLAVTFFAMLHAQVSCAVEYLGLDIGKQTLEQAKSQLTAASAQFEGNYGYKGYKDLTFIKITQFDRFSKFGVIQEGWLRFSPKEVLYQIMVTYADSGDTFKVLKDALDSKYGHPQVNGTGFNQNYSYLDGKVNIILERNTFGFGADQKTTLLYTYTPLLGEVKKMQAHIESEIRKGNAKKAGSDL